MANRLTQKIKNLLKIATLGAATGYVSPVMAQSKDFPDNEKEKKENIITTPSPETLVITSADIQSSKSKSFAALKEIPPLLSSLNPEVEYVLDITSWKKDSSDVAIKRVTKDQIYHDGITDVMEAREGPDGDIVNLNSSHSRMLICQADLTIGKEFVRYLYCSNNENLHKMAANYVQCSPEALQEIHSLLYDKAGELKYGEQGIRDRRKAINLMKKLPVTGISSGSKYSAKFISDFKKLSQEHYNDIYRAEKDFSLGFYPLHNPANIPAQKAAQYAQSHDLRDASCIPLGVAGYYLSSSIAFGCFSKASINLKNKNEARVLKAMNTSNRCDYITLETARQLALAGYDGADKLYTKFQQKIAEDKEKIKEFVDKIITPKTIVPQDAITDYKTKIEKDIKRHQPIPYAYPSKDKRGSRE